MRKNREVVHLHAVRKACLQDLSGYVNWRVHTMRTRQGNCFSRHKDRLIPCMMTHEFEIVNLISNQCTMCTRYIWTNQKNLKSNLAYPSTKNWYIQEPHAPSGIPVERINLAIEYDDSADKAVLFGGEDEIAAPLDDTWFYTLRSTAIYISDVKDAGAVTTALDYGKLNWYASVPADAEIKFQIATLPLYYNSHNR